MELSPLPESKNEGQAAPGDVRYGVNAPGVTHQLIEGEVIVLNLLNGFYYSLRDTAATIWAWCDGASRAEVGARAQQSFEGPPQLILDETTRFWDELVREELLVPRPGALSSVPDPIPGDESVGSTTFVAPVLEKFTEMSDLLLVDPIHDVDSQGWPHVLPESERETPVSEPPTGISRS